MPTAPVNGIDLYYETHGEGPAIVLMNNGSHLAWWQQVPYFSRDYRCVTYDRRGSNLSTHTDGRGASAFVDDLAGLLDQLEVDETYLVGLSASGGTAFRFALAQPERVKALVMAGSSHIPSSAIAALRRELREAGVERPGTFVSASFPTREPARAFLWEQIRRLNFPNEGRQVDPPTVGDVDLAEFSVPTLFVFGAEDAQIPPEVGRLAATLVPGARYIEVPEAGHVVSFERPDEFNEIVSRFFKEVSGLD